MQNLELRIGLLGRLGTRNPGLGIGLLGSCKFGILDGETGFLALAMGE